MNPIEIKNVSKSFGKIKVLREINLKLEKGIILGLIGPSGAGKSTIIKTTLGMERIDSGKALVFGVAMPNRKLLKRIGYMAQSDALYLDLTGRENLEFFAQMKEVKSKIKLEIERVSKIVNLTTALNEKVAAYSGGMMRRLSLAIALLGEPDLLILDEPTVGIDPLLRNEIWKELYQLRDKGKSILVTTHVMSEAELTDQVALLRDGKIIANDTPQKLKKEYGVNSIEKVFLKAEEK